MNMSKQFLNSLRGLLRKSLKEEEEEYYAFLETKNTVINLLDKVSIIEKKQLIVLLNEKLSVKISLLASNKSIIDVLNEETSKMERCIEKIKILMRALSKDGFIEVTYSFPIFCSIDTNVENPFLQYLVVSGIKYNGTHEKTEQLMDSLELKLHNYEKQMANLINEDLTINWENGQKFSSLFHEYLKYFYEVTSFKYDFIFGIKSSLDSICEKMSFYISSSRLVVKLINEEKEEKIPVVINCGQEDSTQVNTILEDDQKEFEEKERIRIEQERFLLEKQRILLDIATEEDIILYNQAKVSDNIEATQIVKDINAIIELLLETTTDEEKIDLINECEIYFSYLKEVLKVKEELIKPNIVFYSYNQDGNEIPYVLDDIRNTQKGFYKQIYLSFTKLLEGNISGREVLGKLPIRVWAAKGLDFRIFYTKINDVVIIIRALTNDKGYDEIKKIVSSKIFLTYYDNIKLQIEKNTWDSQSHFIDLILKELTTTNSLKKKKNN